jgi:hypothetical protein
MVNLIGRGTPAQSAAPPLRPDVLAQLEARLATTRRWCALRPADLPVSRRLRTPILEPDLEDEPSLAALEAALHELAERRRAQLEQIEWAAGVTPPRPGRLLVCEVNMGLGDGLAEAGSRGFFDAADLPPWDTWLVAYGKTRPSEPDQPLESLITWVPEPLAELAAAGIAAHRSACLHFVEERRDGLAEQLGEVLTQLERA